MARKMNGLLVLGGLAVGAWWLFGRRADAASAIPTIGEAELLSIFGIQSASVDTIGGLKLSGLVPKDAIEVYLDPTPGAPALRAVAGQPGYYVVSSGALEGIAGEGSLSLPMEGYGKSSNQAVYAAAAGYGGYGKSSNQAVYAAGAGYNGFGATDTGMAKLTGGHLQATPALASPASLYGDYVQLPYGAGTWA